MSEKRYKVISQSIEEFKKLEDKLKTLPESVMNQVETIEQGFSYIKCTFFKLYDNKVIIYIPSDNLNMCNVNSDGFRCYNDEFIFEMELTEKQQVEIRFR